MTNDQTQVRIFINPSPNRIKKLPDIRIVRLQTYGESIDIASKR